jgi:hypothetical protein
MKTGLILNTRTLSVTESTFRYSDILLYKIYMNDVIFCAECNKKKYINMLSRIEEFEYSKWVISIRKSKDRQHSSLYCRNGSHSCFKVANNSLLISLINFWLGIKYYTIKKLIIWSEQWGSCYSIFSFMCNVL